MRKQTVSQLLSESARAQKARALARFYKLHSILGNHWAIFYALLGGRMAGKSYVLAEYMIKQKRKWGDECKIYWLRISPTSTKNLLANNAAKLIDPDIVRRYGLDLYQRSGTVYDRDGIGKICEVMSLASFGKNKGAALYDKDFTGRIIIILDEFQLEVGEKRTSFDILYAFTQQLETIARTRKNNIQIFLVGNTLEEASSILKAFNFIPERFGRFYLRSRRCVIDNIAPTEEYFSDRDGSIADLLGQADSSNYLNVLKKDVHLIDKRRVQRPTGLIRFGKNPEDWYTIYDNKIIRRYNGEHVAIRNQIAMLPYCEIPYNRETRQIIIDQYDQEFYRYNTLIAYTYFTESMRAIRSR